MTEAFPDAKSPVDTSLRTSEAARMNLSLIVGILSLVLWIAFVFIHPVATGWVHLLLGLGVVLLIRRVVTGRAAW
jgi:uncharacterized membrane protein